MNDPLSLPPRTAVRLAGWLLLGLLAGCGHADVDDDDAAAPAGQVAVTTTRPARQTFHDTVEAWGVAAGDPRRVRDISLAHGGQLVALNVAAGQQVRRGMALLTVAPDPAARNAYQQAQSGWTLARDELRRTEQLAAQRLATQSQLAAARKALADARTALDAQRAIGAGAATETVDAPSDGVVSALHLGLGERFAANTPLLGFTPAHALIARLGVQPEDGRRLRPGMPVTLRAVFDDTTVAGTLRLVGQSIDPQTHLLDAQVQLSADAPLLPGAALEAHIRTADFTAWSVPRDAVLQDDKGSYLFQVEQGRARRVAVSLRNAGGDPVGVQGPIDAQAPVIVLGVYELHDGEAVREASR